jgi:hypothetical protein
MSATTEPDGGDRLLLALTTEHFTLQAARSATISESAGRPALIIVMVSSGLIALAFTGQATALGPPFWALALLLLPALLLHGTLTYLRLVQSAIDDLEFARGIERIHGYYRGLGVSAATYFPVGGQVGGAPSRMWPPGGRVGTTCTPIRRPWSWSSTGSSRGALRQPSRARRDSGSFPPRLSAWR